MTMPTTTTTTSSSNRTKSCWDGTLSWDEFCIAARAFAEKWNKFNSALPQFSWVLRPKPTWLTPTSQSEGYLSMDNVIISRTAEECCCNEGDEEDGKEELSCSDNDGFIDYATLVAVEVTDILYSPSSHFPPPETHTAHSTMAVLNCYISITSTATPLPQDSSTNPPPSSAQPASPSPRQTKILLPDKKPLKWSTGVAPGDYGGPPTTSKLRKYWGGQEEDPLTSDDFMWNKDFMGRMKRLIEDPDDDDSLSDPFVSPSKEEPSGFLSLNRVMSLDSLEVDLSKELKATSKTVVEEEAEETKVSGTAARKWRPAPTRREQEKWDRATKAATGGSGVMLREIRRPKGDPEVLAAQSTEQYFKLKKKLQFLTLGIGGIGLISAYISYTPEIAASYGAGLLGSLAYMRMLGNTVDAMAAGAKGAKGLIKGAVGQPRLLVPFILVMVFNRWNGILVPEYGFMQLELIPMLVGFFTYKIATFFLAIEDAISLAGENTQV